MAQGFMLHRRRKVVSKAFKTTWNVTVGTLTIPSQPVKYNCVVDWGDGTAPTRHTVGSLVHTYTTAGLHQISITGQYSGFKIGFSAASTRLISVDNWGNVGFSDMDSAFQGCSNLVNLPHGAITGAENVTSFYACFVRCPLTSIPAGLFNKVPNAADFNSCFYNCTSLISIPVGLFLNCFNITTFQSCFGDCTSLTSVPSGLFDNVPNATRFDGCFYNCASIDSVPEGLFLNCPNVTTFQRCFYDCAFSLPTTMFNYTALADKQPDMGLAFVGNVSKTGTAYPLWDYITITSRNSCYRDQTALTNYADIPSKWK